MYAGKATFRHMPTDKNARATMLDVARKAGVSEKSVSRVVNREAHVSEKLKTKVEAAIAELGYIPDPAARSLAGARSFTISLLVDTRGPEYAIKLIEGAYRACKEAGYHLQIDNLDSSLETDALVAQLGESLRNTRLDGFVLTPPFSDMTAVMDFLEGQKIRFARVAPFRDRARSPCAFMDDAAAAAEVADLLIGAGHRRIGLVNGLLEHGSAISRRRGFIERVKWIAPDAEILEVEGNFQFKPGIEAGKKLLSLDNPPTAIFAANDSSAAGVMAACAQLGISIPDELSICGFDDIWVANAVWPYLTTVSQPVSELAESAMRLLLENGFDKEHSGQVLLAHKLIERDSVKKLTQD